MHLGCQATAPRRSTPTRVISDAADERRRDHHGDGRDHPAENKVSHGARVLELSLTQPVCKIRLQHRPRQVDLALNRRQQDVARKSKNRNRARQADRPRGAEADALAVATASRCAPKSGQPKPTSAASGKPKRKTARRRRNRSCDQAGRSRKRLPRAPRQREPSDEEIRIRAYFIAERRIQLSLQGDSAHDWIEARRQLVEEANSRPARRITTPRDAIGWPALHGAIRFPAGILSLFRSAD